MEAQEFLDLIPDYILQKLSPAQEKAFEAYQKEHPEVAKDIAEWDKAQSALYSTDIEPTKAMDQRFYQFLKAETQHETVPKSTWYQNLFSTNRIGMGALATFILLVGFFGGHYYRGQVDPDINYNVSNNSVIIAEQETQDVRAQLVMSLAEQNSASKRLEALNEADKLGAANDAVITALFKMLNTDTNVNVRLAAVSPLSKFVSNPKVREGLVMSIISQDSPLVQIALADLMVTLKEKKSINSMETLLKKPELNDAVKLKLKESINKIS